MPQSRTTRTLTMLLSAVAVATAFAVSAGGTATAAAAATRAHTLSSAATDGASWSVSPADTPHGAGRPFFDYALDPGETIDDAFAVRNDGAAALTLAVYAADAFTTREGNIDLLPAGEQSEDAGTWVELDTAEIVLQPGETRVVPFSIAVPADARPGDHPAGIVTSLRSDDDGAQVQVDRRLGSRLFVRVAGELSPSVEVSDPVVSFSGTWNPLALGQVDVVYTLSNTGDTRVTAVGATSIHGPAGVASLTTGAEQLPEVLPGSTVEVTQTVSGVAALVWLGGAVNVIPTSVGIGAAQLDAVVLPFGVAAVPMATLLILAGIAVLVGAIVLLMRRRRRSA